MIDDTERRGPGRPRTVTVPAMMPPFKVGDTVTVSLDEKPKKFPVKLLRGYFPADPDRPKHPNTGGPVKVERGEIVDLPLDEAKGLIASGLAERADSLP